MKDFLSRRMDSLIPKLKSGRPPKLTKSQRKELYDIVVPGPEATGFPGACWRTPMIQEYIEQKFKVKYNVHYLSELLKNMGFSFQRSSFVASQRDAEARNRWLSETWSEICKPQADKGAYIFFGDECSFAQWGSHSRTWAPVGQTPIVQTGGTRKNYKVFGVIEYSTGKFISQGVEGKLNGQFYIQFLEKILRETRKHIILIQDCARYHTCKDVKKFMKKKESRITVYTLPSYSPDYNPIENLWKKIKEGHTHLHFF